MLRSFLSNREAFLIPVAGKQDQRSTQKTHKQQLRLRARGFPHSDEVSSAAVDVHSAEFHADQLAGLGHEEGGTAQVGGLCSEGELTLHRHHVHAAWGGQNSPLKE